MVLCLLAALAAPLLSQPYDLILAGGRVYDGTGNAWFQADIGIRGDSIAAMGNLDAAPAQVRLDLRALAVAPGFLDTHSHGGRGIFATPLAENLIRQGVTTIIEGPDGASPVPIQPFLEKVAAARPAVNFGMLVGQGSVRSQVMGLENRKATPEEIGAMKELVRQAMEQGAFGLSTGLFYVPGNFTPTEEVVELAKVAARFGGVHTSHMRDESAGVLASVRETIRIGEEAGLPTQLTHHKVVGRDNWGRSVDTLRLVDEARARGVDATIDQYPYTASSTGTAALFPQWSQAGGQKAFLERLQAPDTRARIKAGIVDAIVNARGGGDPRNIVMASCTFDPSLAGKSLADLARRKGWEPTPENAAEVAIEIQGKGGCSAIYHAMKEEDVDRILRYPHTMVASDGGIPRFGEAVPHPRSYGTFARVLGLYVRERKVLSLEEAVRRMSGLPAGRFRIFDRGLLRPGMKADVVVFDPATVADKATFANPHQYAVGFTHVVVNGKLVLRNGVMTGERPGRILYGPGYIPR